MNPQSLLHAFTMSRIQKKKKIQIVTIQEKAIHPQGKRQTDSNLEMIQMLKLSNKDFKADLLTMLNDGRANVLIINKNTEILIRKTYI